MVLIFSWIPKLYYIVHTYLCFWTVSRDWTLILAHSWAARVVWWLDLAPLRPLRSLWAWDLAHWAPTPGSAVMPEWVSSPLHWEIDFLSKIRHVIIIRKCIINIFKFIEYLMQWLTYLVQSFEIKEAVVKKKKISDLSMILLSSITMKSIGNHRKLILFQPFGS